MHLAYLDETYLRDKEHSILALVAPMDAVPLIEENLNSVAAKARKQYGEISDDIEFHGYELSSGEGDWTPLKTPRMRSRIYKEAITAITQVEGIAVCRGTTNLTDKSPGDPHQWSLTFTLECINRLVAKKNDRVLAICDDVQNKAIYQEMYARFRRYGTPGNYPSNLEKFTDGLHFTPSHHSRMVQAIDLIAYVYRRNFIQKYSDPRAQKVFSNLWEEIAPLPYRGHHRTW